MPLLNRLTDDNGHHDDPPPGNLSPIMPGRAGRPSYSLEALRERVERQFQDETAARDDILRELDTDEKRRAMLGEVTDYVLAVEAVTLSPQDRNTLIETAYRNLFSFGPLDGYLDDEAITEITANGPYNVHVRHGLGPMQSVSAAFDDRVHLAEIVERIAALHGVKPGAFLEIGVTLKGRPARMSVIAPPVSAEYSLAIRLHPRQPLTLQDLHTRFRAVPPQAAALLSAILRAGHGLLIVGDVGQGKTTLASALIHTLPDTARITVVERAAEMVLPERVTRHSPAPGGAFADAITSALDESPDWLVLDEIRGDESAAIWDALTRDPAPRLLWVFRGSPQPARLRSALNMLIRKTHPALPQETLYHALARHLPFVAAFKTIAGSPRLQQVIEMTPKGAGDNTTLAIVPLISEQDGGWLVTENRPTRALDLPGDYWEGAI